jgi:hypothetical protein
MYGSAMRADVVVAPPGGALDPALLDVVHPHTVVVPSAPGAITAPASDVATVKTGTDGDVTFAATSNGLSMPS